MDKMTSNTTVGYTDILERLPNLTVLVDGQERQVAENDQIWEIGQWSKFGIQIIGISSYKVTIKKNLHGKRSQLDAPVYGRRIIELLKTVLKPPQQINLTLVKREVQFLYDHRNLPGFSQSTRYNSISMRKDPKLMTTGWRLVLWPPIKLSHYRYHESFLHGHCLLDSKLTEYMFDRFGNDPDGLPDILYIGKRSEQNQDRHLQRNEIVLRWWIQDDKNNEIYDFIQIKKANASSPQNLNKRMLQILYHYLAIVLTMDGCAYIVFQKNPALLKRIHAGLAQIGSEFGLIIPIDSTLHPGWTHDIPALKQ